jgi:hypothetical protein
MERFYRRILYLFVEKECLSLLVGRRVEGSKTTGGYAEVLNKKSIQLSPFVTVKRKNAMPVFLPEE